MPLLVEPVIQRAYWYETDPSDPLRERHSTVVWFNWTVPGEVLITGLEGPRFTRALWRAIHDYLHNQGATVAIALRHGQQKRYHYRPR